MSAPEQPDWIERLRRDLRPAGTLGVALWPLLCDCIEAAVQTEHPLAGPLAEALTRLMAEVQR